jgi:hypothetical protein
MISLNLRAFIVFSIFAINNPPYCKQDSVRQKSVVNLSFKIISSRDNTWGYDIYRGTKNIIHQPTIPGISGDKGFKTKKQAEETAKLVITKIEEGQIPPTVTVSELKKLNAF